MIWVDVNGNHWGEDPAGGLVCRESPGAWMNSVKTLNRHLGPIEEVKEDS